MEELEGKSIKRAEVDGHGILLEFTDGTVFSYDASDGGYSCYGLYESMEAYFEED